MRLMLLRRKKLLFRYSVMDYYSLFVSLTVSLQADLGMTKNLVSETLQPGAFPVVASGQVASLCYDCGGYEQTYLKMPESPYSRQ